MVRGSKVFRLADVSESNASGYPEPFRGGQRKRYNRRLGDHGIIINSCSISWGSSRNCFAYRDLW
jgi:hypothetical protein